MLTNTEINKLFFKNLGRFIVQDRIPENYAPKYDWNSDVVYGRLNEEPLSKYISTYGLVPLYEFETIQQYEEMFVSVIKKAVEISGQLIECKKEDFSLTLANQVFKTLDQPLCSAVYAKSDKFTKTCNILTTINKKANIDENSIYCFPYPEFVGVCPLSTDLKMGLAILAKSVCEIKVI